MPDLARIRALISQRKLKHALPQALYNDADVFAFDLAAIHSRNWIFAGFEAEIAEPGEHLALAIGQSPIVLVRGQDGVLRGFHNTCRHRGSQICGNGHGLSSWLICPYHQWTYGLDGKLANAPRMGADFDAAKHGLKPIHVQTVAGTVYVCLAETAPRFDEFARRLEPLLAPHDLSNAKLAFESTLVMHANWKLVMENARECYHCVARHPELSLSFPARPRRSVQFADGQHFDRFRTRMADAGLETGPFEGEWWQAMRFPLNEGTTTLSMDGRPACSKLMCDAADGDIGSMRWSIEPHCFAHATSDTVFMFGAIPLGPQETAVTSKWLVRKDAVDGVDYRTEELIELWTKTNEQDLALCEANQRGVNSLGYTPGPYSEEAESLVIRFSDWYCTEALRFIETMGK